MNSRAIENLLKYGISNSLASRADSAGLTATKVRALSQKDLVEKYKLDKEEAKLLSIAVRRKAIKADTMQLLLERSNFLCCVCKGNKSHTYIVHHIIEYEKTQDNSYNNLIVLCPSDHDLAHQSGLSLRITEAQLRKAKQKWEQQVVVSNTQRAAQKIEIYDDAIDYVNIKRIEELCVRLFGKIPRTTLTASLRHAGILRDGNSFDQKYVQSNLSGGRYLFDYITHQETEHYKQLLQKIASVTDFIDLDTAVLSGIKTTKSTEGKYAYFIGGVTAKGPKFPITAKTPPVTVSYSRKPFKIEWVLDPLFLMSTSAIARIGGTNRYIIYCLVRTVEKQPNGIISVKASPLLIAQPTVYVDKTPIISYLRRNGHYVDGEVIDD